MIEGQIGTKIFWTIIAFSTFSLPVFGTHILIYLLGFYALLIASDFLTGYLASRKKKQVNSRIGINGLLNKCVILTFVFIFVFFSAGINYFTDINSSKAILIGIVPHVFLSVFIYLEFISILENSTIIFDTKREGKVFSTLSYLVKKLFNTSLKKLKAKAEEKIEEKINNLK